jgi:E3 ubiquitin-protein ligase UBR3
MILPYHLCMSLPYDLCMTLYFFSDHNALNAQLQHTTFLEELVFWTVKYEFPERLVCLLLKMLPDRKYKEAFTTSFVLHYSR